MRLSEHFSLLELTLSQYADRNNIKNQPTPEDIERLRALCTNVLEPIRKQFGPLYVTSGFRCENLNRGIGGSPSSQHTLGEAADIVSYRYSPYEISKWIQESSLPFDQNIYEGRWTHISHSARHMNRRVGLTAIFSNQPVRYMSGIIEQN